jgi:hypothetical protein
LLLSLAITGEKQMNRQQPRVLWPLATLVAIAGVIGLAGCGEKRVAVYPVAGKLTYKGESLAGAQVVLHPVDKLLPSDVSATGTVKEDGTFHIGVYEEADGAPPGEYVATVQWFRVVPSEGGGGRGPNVLPIKYASPKTSPIRVTVKPGQNQVSPIELPY